MLKVFIPIFAVFLSGTVTNAADYNYIDPGDHYWINDWGSENRYVTVVRKLGNGNVKVRNAYTGASSNVRASELLTERELQIEETKNTVGGTALGIAIMVCLLNPEKCEQN